MTCHDVEARLGAYLDGELSEAAASEVRAHLDACPACRALYDRHRALAAGVRAVWPRRRAPDTVRARVKGALEDAAPRFGLVRLTPWREIGWVAAAVAAVVLTWFGHAWWAQRGALTQQVIAAHVRSLMPGHLLDVASTDQHTVKPWFDGRLDFSPPVVDLAAQGFPLVGGRLDYLDGRPVAALVYGRRLHRINLFVWPGSAGAGLVRTSRGGYNVEHWTASGMTLWAVSDLNPAELGDFVRLLRGGASATGASPPQPSGPPGP